MQVTRLLLVATLCQLLRHAACDGSAVANITKDLLKNVQMLHKQGLPISAPDIYPASGNVAGEVTVTFVVNAKDADTLCTTDGSDPRLAGGAPCNEPLRLFKAGNITVRAVARPSFSFTRSDSEVRTAWYFITASSVAVPVPLPRPGRFRGSVVVTLSSATPGAKVKYVTDVPSPNENLWVDYTQSFTLDNVGDHVLLVEARTAAGERSAVGKFHYIVTPQLVFTVATECAACKGKPTIAEPFTVYLQSATFGSLLRLSAHAGCGGDAPTVIGTQVRKVTNRMAYRFRATGEPGEVWVCVKEPGQAAYELVPQRHRPHEEGKISFRLAAAVRPFVRGEVAPSPTTADEVIDPPAVSPPSQPASVRFGSFLLWIAIVGAVVFIVRVFRRPAVQPRHRHVPVEREELQVA
jgi:hypothetical protein